MDALAGLESHGICCLIMNFPPNCGADRIDSSRSKDGRGSAPVQSVRLTIHRCERCNGRVDRLEAMHIFLAVAEQRGFAPAARRLKLSPSAVTRGIAALEARLGTRLLQRTTRSVKLTDAGARFLDQARSILAAVEAAEGSAKTEATVPSGRFMVSAPRAFGRVHVAPVLHAFLAQYPGVIGELSLSDRIVNLVEEGIDAAVRIGTLEDSSHVSRLIGTTRRVVVASPDYLLQRKVPRRLEDLARYDIIHVNAVRSSHDWGFVQSGQERRVSFQPKFLTNSWDAALGHAEGAGGLVQVLAYQAVELVRAGKLRVVLSEFEPRPLPIQIVYPSSRLLSAKVRAFVELVATSCDWQFLEL
jgi:DNA-binding transcriptional LysR family regulator